MARKARLEMDASPTTPSSLLHEIFIQNLLLTKSWIKMNVYYIYSMNSKHVYWAYEQLLQNSHILCHFQIIWRASSVPSNKSVHCAAQTQNQWDPDSILLASPVENLKGPNLERMWKDVARGEYERRPAWRIWKQSHQRFQIPAPLSLSWLTKGPHL